MTFIGVGDAQDLVLLGHGNYLKLDPALGWIPLLPDNDDGFMDGAISLDGSTVITPDIDGGARLIDVKSGTIKGYIEDTGGLVFRCWLDASGETALTLTDFSTLRLWNCRAARSSQTTGALTSEIRWCWFSANDAELVTLGAGGEFHWWDVGEGRLVHATTLAVEEGPIEEWVAINRDRFAFLTAERLVGVASVRADRSVRILASRELESESHSSALLTGGGGCLLLKGNGRNIQILRPEDLDVVAEAVVEGVDCEGDVLEVMGMALRLAAK